MNTPTATSGSVKQRVMDVAFDLFYKQGYRATGVNQIIADSGVAKASFYQHFPKKEDLLILYARHTRDEEIKEITAHILSLPSPLKRFFGLMEAMGPWLLETEYRGCPFQNLLAEVSADHQVLRDIAIEHRQNLRELLTPLARDLLNEITPPVPMTAESLTDTYLMLLEGAIVLCVLHRQPWPVDQAIETLRTMLGLPVIAE